MRRLWAFVLIVLLMLSATVNVSLAYDMIRPDRDIDPIGGRAESANVGNNAAVSIGVEVQNYENKSGDSPYYGHDGLKFTVFAASNVRKGIEYEYSIISSLNGYWYTPTEQLLYAGDETLYVIPLPFDVTFYGGPGQQNSSAVYNEVWVSSNGFLTFYPTNACPNSANLPNPAEPNAVIAACWDDLDATDGSITYGETSLGYTISWNNVLNKNTGDHLTFQIVISRSHYPGYRGQNVIYLLYHTVTWPQVGSENRGIEDQEGYRGVEPPPVGSWQGIRLRAKQPSPEIRSLNILMSKSDAAAQLYISTERWSKRGQNTRWTTPQPETPSNPLLTKAIYGGSTLLMTKVIGAANPAAGLICGTVLLTLQLGQAYYEQEYEKRLRETNPTAIRDEYNSPGTDFAYLNASAATDASDLGHPVDATVGTAVYWIFLDDKTLDHDLWVTAQLKYCYWNANMEEVNDEICTSVHLSVFIGHELVISSSHGGTTDPAPGTYDCHYGDTVTVTALRNSQYWFSHWLLDGVEIYSNPINITMYTDHALEASFFLIGGPGGCPFVSTWNGTHYVLDNNLIPAAEYFNGADVTDYYMLQQPLIRRDGKYSLLIWDLDKHSFLDYAQFIAVDHKSDVNVAVSPYGQILTYKNPAPLVSAFNKKGEDISSLLNTIDEQYYQGYSGDYIQLDFSGADSQNGAKLVITSDGCYPYGPCETPKSPLYIQVLNSSQTWQTVATIYTRIYWSTDVIDMSNYLPDANGQLHIRISLTSADPIDFIGLDITKQGKYELSYGNLATANHTRLGDVKELLTASDDIRVELLPGEQFTIKFTLPQNTEEKRDIIIVLEGHYFIPS